MPLHALSENELRDHCKRSIEGLELWLRRLVDTLLSEKFGPNYVHAIRDNGDRVINSRLTKTFEDRRDKEPDRFSRLIDAAFLGELIEIICKPTLYDDHFKIALNDTFPQGNESARTFLSRLVAPRNALYHANPLSVHDAYRILCYSTDVVEGLKKYYVEANMDNLYNVPMVIRISDSLGHVVNFTGQNRPLDGPAMVDFSFNKDGFLHCGDTLSIEVEVDPTFDPKEYEIRWTIANIGSVGQVGNKFQLLLTEHYVSTRFCAVCLVTSNRSWHKLGSCDDQIDIAYRVLPPP